MLLQQTNKTHQSQPRSLCTRMFFSLWTPRRRQEDRPSFVWPLRGKQQKQNNDNAQNKSGLHISDSSQCGTSRLRLVAMWLSCNGGPSAAAVRLGHRPGATQVATPIRPVGEMMTSIHPLAALLALLHNILCAPFSPRHVKVSPPAMSALILKARLTHGAANGRARLGIILLLGVGVPILKGVHASTTLVKQPT